MQKGLLKNLPSIKKVLPTDPFGNVLLLKRFLISVIGAATYSRFNIVNKLKVSGTEYLQSLPDNGVLFLSNHQTYFADVIALYHIFCSVKWKFKNSIDYPIYLLNPRVNNYFVAASETMKDGFIPRLFSLAGAIQVERSWRAKGQNIKREVDKSAAEKIGKALSQGWVVSFPQGTTSPYAPIRKGTAHIIKEFNPIVVPVVINGFRRAFDKKGLFHKKRNTQLSVTFKEPMRFSPEESVEQIVEKITKVIEQEIPHSIWWGQTKKEASMSSST
ncbi:MAG: 1-acyl-sn-glycerol-3-phosphate acyltransferase [Flammeovirgaceae bacterium]|nr:1-acyl-sn-glycerol-3-phosphate acyltransferase [Flammeovirgaceae bacterium]MDW8288646.1 lysophospholipid acyltransferase family protein [Flammeovirgaceae bacterium]